MKEEPFYGKFPAKSLLAIAFLSYGNGFRSHAMQVAPTLGRTLHLAWDAAPRALDPRYATDANSQYLEDLVHCSLFTYDPNGNLEGEIARQWRWRDALTLEVQWGQQFKFRSGRPVGIADILATYRSLLSEDLSPPASRRGALRNLSRLEVEDNNLVFYLKEPDSTFVQNLVIGLLPQEFAQTPVRDLTTLDTCGMYYATKVNSSLIELKINDLHPSEHPQRLKQIVIQFIADETTRFAKLRTGETDLVQGGISRDKLPKLAAQIPHLQILRRPGLTSSYLGFNTQHPLLARREVRQAISMAIDRESIILYVLRNYATAANGLLTPESPFYAGQIPLPKYDPSAAAVLLDELGLPRKPDGNRFTLSLKTTTDLTRLIVAKTIAQQLQKIGVLVKVESLEWSRFKKDVDQGSVELWTLSWIGFKDPDILRHAFASESFPPQGGNRGRYSSPALDELLKRGVSDFSPEKRQEIYLLAQKLIAEEVPYAMLWHEDRIVVANKRVQGFVPYADGRYRGLGQTWLKAP